MNQPISLVLDFETADSNPTNPVVFEIGIIAITRPACLAAGEPSRIVDRLDLQPNHLLQLIDGRTFTADTLRWHISKNTLPTRVGDMTLEAATIQLAYFIARHNPYRIWAWGKDFERTLYENLCGAAGIPMPEYQFRRFACGRDHWQTAFGMDQRPAERSHRAIEDCESEAHDIFAALNHLNAIHAF
jgi:hypothetical protein